jgi:hypothetical protein
MTQLLSADTEDISALCKEMHIVASARDSFWHWAGDAMWHK